MKNKFVYRHSYEKFIREHGTYKIVGVGTNYNYMPNTKLGGKRDNLNSTTNEVPNITPDTIRIPKKGSNAFKRFLKNYGRIDWVKEILIKRNYL